MNVQVKLTIGMKFIEDGTVYEYAGEGVPGYPHKFFKNPSICGNYYEGGPTYRTDEDIKDVEWVKG